MSRQIKFRVWSPETKSFYYSSDIFSFSWEGEEGIACAPIERTDAHIQGRLCRIINLDNNWKERIQQFTGLKDKNNKEVYEGDIVKFSIHGATHGREREDNCGGEVWYNEEDAQFVFGRYTTKVEPHFTSPNAFQPYEYQWYYSMLDEIDMSTFEVIGNIFENK